MATFGSRLRAQREREQIALADIAERTKIRLALLERLEHDDVRQWPTGIFRRSYLRAYAQAIHLDPEAVVAEFLALYPDPSDSLGTAAAEPAGETDAPGRPPTRFRFLLGSALAAIPRRRAHPDEGQAPATLDTERYVSFVPQLDTADDSALAVMETPAAKPPAAEPPAPAIPIIAPTRTPSYLAVVADLCSGIASAEHADELTALLTRAATLVRARGLIVWMWDASSGVLRAGLSHGFPDHVLSQLGGVTPDAENAIARAFRRRSVEIVAGGAAATGALAVPLLTPSGCGGVLALELRDGQESDADIQAIARIVAAQLSMFVGAPQPVA
jgi:transcriptional regulator with XRE-family HTH domain